MIVVAVEGQVGAGKTTLVRLLGRRCHVEPEYAHRRQATSAPQTWTVQREYLREEARRARRLTRLAASGTGPEVVLDRSILSQVAHVHAAAAAGLADDRPRLLAYLTRHQDTVVDPDAFIWVDPPAEVRHARLSAREAGPGRAGTAAVFSRTGYEEAFGRFIGTAMSALAREGRAVRIGDFDPDDEAWARSLVASLTARRSQGARPTSAATLAGLLAAGGSS